MFRKGIASCRGLGAALEGSKGLCLRRVDCSRFVRIVLNQPVREISDRVVRLLLAQNREAFQKRGINARFDLLDVGGCAHDEVTDFYNEKLARQN